MRYGLLALITFGVPLGADPTGLPVRSSPADYSAHAEDKGIRVAAEILDPDQVKNLFSTDLSQYVVVEIAVWPKPDSQLDVSAMDFSLRADGRSIPTRAASPRTIAALNQRRGQERRNDIVLFPTVGVSTGTWGTGTSVGVGVGVGGGPPGPASTDRDRRTMEQELEDHSLPEKVVAKPIAGYLFFPASRGKSERYELLYDASGVQLRMELPAPKRP